MSRSVWKGPFVDPSLLKKVEKMKADNKPAPIKTWSRKSTIIPEFVGVSFLIYNGKKFIPIKISEEMVGHKLGEFSPTRQFPVIHLLIKKPHKLKQQQHSHRMVKRSHLQLQLLQLNPRKRANNEKKWKYYKSN